MSYPNPAFSASSIPPRRNPIGFSAQVPPHDPYVDSAIRKLGFWFCLFLVYIRYSQLQDLLMEVGGANGKILFVFSVPALICFLVSGGLQRLYTGRPAWYWTAFVGWLFVCVPFAFWMGDAASTTLAYFRTDLPMLILLAGLPMTWKECRMVIYAIALAGMTVVSFSLFFRFDYGGRIGLTFGTAVQNPNDYACVLILVLPFIVFLVLRPMNVFGLLRRLFQITGLTTILYALYLVLASGSRGAMIAVLVSTVFLFFKSKGRVRIGLIVALPVAAAILIAVLPGNVLTRLQSFSTDAPDDEAAESAAIRKGLLLSSIEDTVTHPLFGVGPGQFPNFEGKTKSHSEGGFITTHNSYTAISSESGLPGFFFYVAGIISTFLLLHRVRETTPNTSQGKEIRLACLLMFVAHIGYCVAIFFLNFAYFFFLPAFAGMVISLAAAAKREADIVAVRPVPPSAMGINTIKGRPTVRQNRRPAVLPNRFGAV